MRLSHESGNNTKATAVLSVLTLFILLLLSMCLLCACSVESPGDSPAPELPFAQTINCPLSPVYTSITEAHTGQFELEVGSTSLTLECDSVFYGPDSAINRRFIQFGRYFEPKELEGNCPQLDGDIAIADFNGDKNGDIVLYKDGKLTIISIISIVADDTIFRDERVYYTNSSNGYMVSGITELELAPDGGIKNEPGNVSLIDAADLDGDGYNDLLFDQGRTLSIYYGSSDGFSGVAFRLPERTA